MRKSFFLKKITKTAFVFTDIIVYNHETIM